MAIEMGESETMVAGENPLSIAVRYTNGLIADPGCR